MTTAMKDILLREMDHSDRPAAHESRAFPGHEQRLASHTQRIRSAACECGSGMAYADCCMTYDRHRSEFGIQYSMGPDLARSLDRRRAIEDGFRISAFHAFCKAFREEHDPTIRFVRALLASAKPIDDPHEILRWHRRFRWRRTGEGKA